MTDAKHTPGPWKALSPAQWDGADGKWVVPGVAMCGNGELSEGNARLIAAAPDMLAILKRALPGLESLARTAAPEWSKFDRTTVDEAKAAIAKATGEA